MLLLDTSASRHNDELQPKEGISAGTLLQGTLDLILYYQDIWTDTKSNYTLFRMGSVRGVTRAVSCSGRNLNTQQIVPTACSDAVPAKALQSVESASEDFPYWSSMMLR